MSNNKWTRVYVKYPTPGRANEIVAWLEENITGKWDAEPSIVVTNPFTFLPTDQSAEYTFEYESDAIIFKLKWG